ncbi:DUF1818 family protein [Cyanobium sp. PCC 7001]|uniref:DUF1818 family protein n=1 Tax=Cyanobium sp. PCC 7001 TaxID=180281 RepID=UPI0008FEFC37|nr:DUF1818 family protein [Cyanobium sp. PCC 7001]
MRVLEGPGWRLAVAAQGDWPVLIGGDGWAAEFSLLEARLLRRCVLRLVEQLEAIADQLMAEEAITLEVELPCPPGSLWVELEGHCAAWRLRFVLDPGAGARGLEGSWSEQASSPLAAALTHCEALQLEAPDLPEAEPAR